MFRPRDRKEASPVMDTSLIATPADFTKSEELQAPLLAPNGRIPSLKRSWAYRWRILLTAGFVFAGVIATLVLDPPPPESVRHLLTRLAIGWLMMLAGIGVRLWSTLHLGGRKAKTLVDMGPYSLCRNPLYWGTLFLALAQVVFYQSMPLLVSLLIPVALYAWGVVPAEERRLAATFGLDYDAYRAAVPRWLPHFSRYRGGMPPDAAGSQSFRLELGRTAVWLLLPFVAELLMRLRPIFQDWLIELLS